MHKLENRGKLTPESPPCPPPAGEPLFASAHAALTFAFNFSHGTLKKSFLARAVGTQHADRGLGGLDGAAQAGMILVELTQLTTLRQRLLTARYAPQSAPCSCRASCCRGYRESADWRAAVDYLTEYALVAGLTGTFSHFRLRRALVMRYFGVKESFVEMAKACGVDRHTASDYNKRVFEHFKAEERPGFHELDGRLKASGIVSS
jgi:hypothetical protein